MGPPSSTDAPMGKRLGADEKVIELMHALGAWRSARKHASAVKSVDSAIELQSTTKQHRAAVKALLRAIPGGKHETT
jgi:hypothetical protein